MTGFLRPIPLYKPAMGSILVDLTTRLLQNNKGFFVTGADEASACTLTCALEDEKSIFPQ